MVNEKVLTGDMLGVLTNAIYFRGTWVTQFPEDATKTSDFWPGDGKGKSTSAEFMRITDTFDYTESDGVQVLMMPYKGDRLSMMVILPVARNGIAELEESMTAEKIEQWRQDLRPHEVIVEMPKFTMKTGYLLNTPMMDLGAVSVFDEERSDLSGMARPSSDYSPYVGMVLHDAFVEVNEEGTEAAAVSTVVIPNKSYIPQLPVRFVADHPFIFLIQDDESGAILFMGRLSSP